MVRTQGGRGHRGILNGGLAIEWLNSSMDDWTDGWTKMNRQLDRGVDGWLGNREGRSLTEAGHS